MRIAVYLDISNLYLTVKKEHQARIDFRKYLEYTQDFGEVVIKKAFVPLSSGTDNRGFIGLLHKLGIEVFSKPVKIYPTGKGVKKKCDMDVEIVMELIKDIDKYDRIIIGCADGDLLPVYQYLIDQGKEVIILACKISGELSRRYIHLEIPPSLLLKDPKGGTWKNT